MQKENIFKRNKYSFYSAFVVLLMMIFFYVVNGIAPFGNQTILCSDLYHQYAPFLASLSDKIKNGTSLIYDVGNGFGSTFIGNIINYLASPFNLIVVLMGSEYIQLSVAIIVLLKVTLGGFSFSYVIEKMSNKTDINIIVFSVLYSFSAFFVAFYWNIMWYDAVYMLPLLVYSVYRLIKTNKYGMYIFTLTYCIITNYYMGYMLCIASVLFFFYFYFKEHSIKEINKNIYKEKNKQKQTEITEEELNKIVNELEEKTIIKKKITDYLFVRKTIQFGISSVVVGLLSCVVLIPIYSILQNSSAITDKISGISFNFNPMEFIANHFAVTITSFRTSDYLGTILPNVYCGVLTLLLVPLYFCCKNITRREKIVTAILIITFYLSLSVNILNFIWHGFHFPNGLPYRFSFIYIFFLLFIAYKSFVNLKYIEKKAIRIIMLIWVILTIILGLFFAPNKTVLTIPFTIILCVIYTIILHKKMTNAKKWLSVLLCFIVIVEITLPTINSFTTYDATDFDKYRKDVQEMKDIIETNSEKDYYRMELLSNSTMNDNLLYDYNGISTFSSMGYKQTSLIQKYLGICSNSTNSNSYYSQTPIYHMIFGLNYLMNNNENFKVNEDYFAKLGETSNKYGIYESKFKTNIGFATKNDVSKNEHWDYQTYSPFANQKNFINGATNVNDTIINVNNFTYETENISVTYDKKDNPNQEFKFTLTDKNKEKEAYTTITTTAEEKGNYYAYVLSNNFDVTYSKKGMEDIHQYSSISYLYVADLGVLEKGETFETKVKVSPKTSQSGSFYFFVCRMDDEKIKTAYEKIKANGILEVVDYTDTKITTKIDSKTDFIYTSIPYDKNWKIEIDGKLANTKDITLVGGAFIGLNVPSGEHKIVFTYTQPELVIGLCISIFTLFGLFVFGFSRKRKINAQSKNDIKM